MPTTPQIIFAPMAGFSDAPMREIVSQYGADAVVSEMLASQEWKTKRRGVEARALRGNLAKDTRFIVQIAGRDPDLMAETAKFAQDQGAEQIDINMGCPAKKVISGATAGAALLQEPELAVRIVENIVKAMDLPVSVKTRLGWDQHSTKYMVKDFENAGAYALTIHGRTRQQKYSGQADWEAVGEIKSRANILVFVNGDISNTKDARLALKQSGADGVMIGRAAIGQPWLLGKIRADLRKSQFCAQPSMISAHFERILEHYGEEFGVLCARKHLKAYFKNAPARFLRRLLEEREASQLRFMIKEMEAWS